MSSFNQQPRCPGIGLGPTDGSTITHECQYTPREKNDRVHWMWRTPNTMKMGAETNNASIVPMNTIAILLDPPQSAHVLKHNAARAQNQR